MSKSKPRGGIARASSQIDTDLIGLVDRQIAELDRLFPCSACTICQYQTCLKSRHLSWRSWHQKQYGVTP